MANANTDTGKREILEDSGQIHDWPDEAGNCSEETWEVYVKNQQHRAYQDWFPADLIELGRLSRMQVAAIDLQEMLDDEGYIVLGGKNGTTKVEHPAGRALSTLNGNIIQVKRILGMTTNNDGNRESKKDRAKKERQAASATGAKGDNADDGFDRTRLM